MVLWSQGDDARPLHRVDRGARAALAAPHRPRLGDGRVLAAAGVDRRAHRARGRARQAGRAHGRDPAADRPRRCGRSSTSRRSASARSGSTATCCRPTAARAAPRSAARTSRPQRALDRFGLSKALTGSVAAVSVGRRRRRDAARPRLRRGLERRRRRERRDDRRRTPGRGAGDGREGAVRPRAARRACSTSRRAGSRSSPSHQQERSMLLAASAHAIAVGWRR